MDSELDKRTDRSSEDRLPMAVESFSALEDLEWSVFRAFDEIREEWRQLQRSALLTPFQSVEWLEAWHDTVGAGSAPCIITAKSGGRTVLLLPMVLTRRLGLNCLTWMAATWSDYNAPMVDVSLLSQSIRADPIAIWHKVAELVPEANFLSLPKQPGELQGRHNPFVLPGCPESDQAHTISLCDDWEDFQRGRSKSTRRRIRQKRNQLMRKGKLQYRCAGGTDDRRRVIGMILRWKSIQLAERGARNPFKEHRSVEFLQHAADCWRALEVHMLQLDTRIIAGAVTLENSFGRLVYQISFDPVFGRQSPGHLLLEEIIRQQIEEGRERLDLGYGDGPYKVKLTDKATTLQRGLLSVGCAGRVACWIENITVHIKRFVKSNPQLLKLYYAVRARTQKGGSVFKAGAICRP